MEKAKPTNKRYPDVLFGCTALSRAGHGEKKPHQNHMKTTSKSHQHHIKTTLKLHVTSSQEKEEEKVQEKVKDTPPSHLRNTGIMVVPCIFTDKSALSG